MNYYEFEITYCYANSPDEPPEEIVKGTFIATSINDAISQCIKHTACDAVLEVKRLEETLPYFK